MARVQDWFWQWVMEHRLRHPKEFLPDPETEEGRVFFDAWRQAFVLKGISDFAVATEASIRLVGEPAQYQRDHFATLCRYAVDVYRLRNAEGNGTPADSREAAEAASKGCEHCGGQGLVPVYFRRAMTWEERRECHIPEHVAAYCVCPMGRWIEKTHREKSPEIRKRTPDLADTLAGRGSWQTTPPEPVEVNA